jgi:hypothetical protein|nr:MAG: hypothetical protein DIU61_11200 [Bacteroidota bacterium]
MGYVTAENGIYWGVGDMNKISEKNMDLCGHSAVCMYCVFNHDESREIFLTMKKSFFSGQKY